MNLTEIFHNQLPEPTLQIISEQIGADQQQTSTAATQVFSALSNALAHNTTSESGLNAFISALDRDHDGSILDNLSENISMLWENQPSNKATNGSGIIHHILGTQQDAIAQNISQNSGLSMNQVLQLLPILAPIVMGVLGKVKNKGGLDISDLIAIISGNPQQNNSGNIGDLIQTVLKGNTSSHQNSGDLVGNILGGLFGKK
jgi:hypothetical protein